MKTIYHAMILSPLLFALGCAVTADDAQESTSQTDDSLLAVGGVPAPQPTIPPVMTVDASISVRCTWDRNTTSATFDSNGALFSTTPGVVALSISVGRLSMHAGGSLQCNWSTGHQTNLTLQGTDGNFVFYNQTNGTTRIWAAHTRKADNPRGPGVTATFQNDANLVVRNAASTAIWASNSHTFPNARLAFQSDGNLVIYSNDASDPVPWNTGTE